MGKPCKSSSSLSAVVLLFQFQLTYHLQIVDLLTMNVLLVSNSPLSFTLLLDMYSTWIEYSGAGYAFTVNNLLRKQNLCTDRYP